MYRCYVPCRYLAMVQYDITMRKKINRCIKLLSTCIEHFILKKKRINYFVYSLKNMSKL